jgi:hypothetical protein
MTMRTTALALAMIALPAVLWACPVCGLASASDNQSSYVSMSVMLSALPLGMMAGIAFWLYRKNR